MKKIGDREFWDVMERAKGIYSTALEIIKDEFPKEKQVTRQAIFQRCTLNDAALTKLDQIREANIDAAERVIMSAIDEKDKETAKWYLERQGKARGYTKTIEVNGTQNHIVSFEE